MTVMRLKKMMIPVLALGFGLFFCSPEADAKTLSLKVLGQPSATGLIQQNKEKPFFENFSKNVGLDIRAVYTPLEEAQIKSEETLLVLKQGIYDIVSIRTAQAASEDPFLLGQDIVGLNPNYDQARKVYGAYKPHFDEHIQEKYNSKLLGLWPFGPQVLFCKSEIRGLADIKGKKVRVYDENLSDFIQYLGGIPMPIPFSQVEQALSLGICDCAITGASSANTAKWPQHTQYFMPIGFQMGFNGYAINLDTWKKLNPAEQRKMQNAFDGLVEEIWDYSEEIFQDALRCNVGKKPCNTVTPYDLTEVSVSEADLKQIEEAFDRVSFPSWAEKCEKTYPGCTQKWKEILGDVVEPKKQ